MSKEFYEKIPDEVKASIGWSLVHGELEESQTKFLEIVERQLLSKKEKLSFLSKELKMIQYEVGEISRELENT